MSPNQVPISRRAVLLGAAGLAGTTALAACGSTGARASDSGRDVALESHGQGRPIVALFDVGDPYVVTGSQQRLVIGLQGTESTAAAHLPPTARVSIVKESEPIGPQITVHAHSDGTPIVYYPVRTAFPTVGFYSLHLLVDGKLSTQAIQVVGPHETKMVQRGQKMRPVETPTPTDHRGVEPICTRQPMCSLHDITLTQALASGKPTAFLISTPQFCQIGVCGPSLELVIEAAKHYPNVQFLHAEVYDDAVKLGSIQGAALAPAVETYALTYEPVLFVVDGGGVLVDRLDNVFDRQDIKTALDKIA